MTIVCAFCVALTAIVAVLTARHKVAVREMRRFQPADEVRATDYFPLSVGNQWTYKGKAKNRAPDDTMVIEKPVRVTMTVERVVRRGDASLYIMRGSPADAQWSLTPEDRCKPVVEPPPSRYGLLVAANKMFPIPDGRIAQVSDALENGASMCPVTADEPAFEFPLFEGQRFGDSSQLARKDDASWWNVWYVEEVTESAVPEAGSRPVAPTYHLVYRTNPDYTEVLFVPYVGITQWSYRHHGTPAEAEVSLTGCKTHLGN